MQSHKSVDIPLIARHSLIDLLLKSLEYVGKLDPSAAASPDESATAIKNDDNNIVYLRFETSIV